MPIVTFDFPEETVAMLGGTPEQFSRELRLAAAIFWYTKGMISQGKGAEIAGLSRREFIEALGRAQVEVIQIIPEELKEEVERDLQARCERHSAHLPDTRRGS
jgi:predicted HTH domain antitoxin